MTSPNFPISPRKFSGWLGFPFGVVVGGLLAATVAAADAPKASFDLPADSAERPLRLFSQQSGLEVVFPSGIAKGVRTAPVKGEMPARAALDAMLKDTGLVVFEDTKTGAFSVRKETPAEAKNAAGRPTGDRAAEMETIKLDTFEVMDSKVLNMDLKRSADDAQPYVIFDRGVIERSGAVSLDDFLKQRLTMNTQALSNNQISATTGPNSQINLRGLGTNQTLVLVDGHRAASPVTLATGVGQSDISGIPISAVERIEVLPTTASGIYGGTATGGVVNIILRRDYAGAELKTTYDNSFSTDSAIRTVDLSAGFTLERGRTHVLFAAHYSDAHNLITQDRDFFLRGRASIVANNPNGIYGASSPVLGLTTNIRSSNGTPLFGAGSSNVTFVPVGYAGRGGLAPLQVNAGKYNFALANTALSQGGGRFSLLNGPTQESLTATIRREFTSNLQAFVEASGSKTSGYFPASNTQGNYTINANAPNNPFGQALAVKVPIDLPGSVSTVRNNDRRVVGGIIARLPRQWNAEADYTWDSYTSKYQTFTSLSGAESALIANGTLDVLRDLNSSPLDFTPYIVTGLGTSPFRTSLGDATLRLSGPLFSLPAGAPTLSTSLQHRDEWFAGAYQFVSATRIDNFPTRSQAVDSGYIELKIPLVAPRNNLPGISVLELQLAGRRDEYAIKGATSSVTVGSTTPVGRATEKLQSSNPTVGLRYEPVPDVTLRASYGTGFLPPTIQQVVPTPGTGGFIVAGFFTDPRRGNEPNAANQAQNLRSGGNPNLRPEKSKSWSAGAIFQPRAVPGLRLSVDYTHIDKTDNITTLVGQTLVNNEAYFPERIVRAPVAPGDPYGMGKIVGLDITLLNISRAVVEAYDVSLDYEMKSASAGTFDFYLAGTRQTHYTTQTFPGTPFVENVGIQGTAAFGLPLKWKANASLTWKGGRWTVGWAARYFDSYLVSLAPATILNQGGNGYAPSQIYHDVFVSCRLGRARPGESATRWARLGSWLRDGTECQIGVRDLFNTKPPFDAGNLSTLYSPLGDPRQASYYVSVKKAF